MTKLPNTQTPNAFTLVKPAIQIKPTRVSKKDATRVNSEASLAAFIPNSKKAPR